MAEETSCKFKGDTDYHRDFNHFRQFHDEAFLYVTQAIALDENGEGEKAQPLYERGLRLIEQALAIQIDQRHNYGVNFDAVQTMQRKMKKTKEEVQCRLEVLATRHQTPIKKEYEVLPHDPPSYDEACGISETSNPAATLNHTTPSVANGSCTHVPDCEIPVDATVIFSIPRGVQIFFISEEGYVSAPSYPTGLVIFRIRDHNSTDLKLPGILQIGDWSYPLHPGRFPMFQSYYGAYIFPDTNAAANSGAAVGVLLDDSEVDDKARKQLESILRELAQVRDGRNLTGVQYNSGQPSDFSRRLSEGIIQASVTISKGLTAGAESTSRLVRQSAAKLKQRITPEEKPMNVNPNVQKGIEVARGMTGVAVKVSGYLVSRLGSATMSLGRYMAPKVRYTGTQMLCRATGQDEAKASATMGGVMEVAAGGIKGFSTIYVALEEAAAILAKSLANETVELVSYKYGAAAGSATNQVMSAAGNMYVANRNIHHLGVKGIAKRAAKDTGKALVEDHYNEKDDSDDKKTLPEK